MPMYEYECEKNGHRFELIRKFSDPPLKACIHCKSKVRKLLSASAISFKGTGWYVTDYAGKQGGNGGGSKSKKDPGSESKNESAAPAAASSSEKTEKPARTEKPDAKSGKKSD